jgi:hypothetical protein
MALNVVSSDRLSTNVKTSNLATGLSSKVGESKNIIINGAMNVAQRGTTSTSTTYRTVDRMRPTWAGTDEALTQAQHALTSSDTGPWAKGFRNSLHLTNGNQTSGAGTTDSAYMQYRVEAQDIANSGWDYTSASSYLTISFWVKSSVAQIFYVDLQTHDGTAKQYSFAYTCAANTWLKVEHSIPGHADLSFDNNSAIGLTFTFSCFLGTNYTHSGASNNTWRAYDAGTMTLDQVSTWWTTNDATWEITGLQLEVGDTATEFEYRRYGDELQKCLRYFWSITGDNYDKPGISTFANSASTCRAQVKFPVPMRIAPSFTGSATAMMMDAADDSANFDIEDFTLNNVTTEACPSGCTLEVATSGMTSGQAGDLEFKANSGFMQFSAEL